jgi:anti-sigma B factor antagonist
MALNRASRAGEPRHERSILRGDVTMSTMDGSRPRFRIDERLDDDGVVWLALFGELDLSVSDEFRHRLGELRRGGLDVRLDLSQLEFIDSSGLRELIGAVSESRRDGCRLEVGTDVQGTVRRVIDLVGVGSYIWPVAG